jgi:DNA-3-methyladenine glycosylase
LCFAWHGPVATIGAIPTPVSTIPAAKVPMRSDRRRSSPQRTAPPEALSRDEIFAVRRLNRRELPVDTETLARFLIGKTLVHDAPEGRMSGRIVETEAYVIGDSAAHAFRGETARNRSLFLERGHAYVYFIYGCWFSLNVSGERPGIGAGVLLRALEPLEGIALMQRRRPDAKPVDLARGPGRLATALGIDRRYDGVDLCAAGRLWLGAAARPAGAIGASVRIGLSREAHRMLRFYERGNPHVSGTRRLNI